MKETKQTPEERFHSPGYHEINKARWDHLLSLGIDFKGKSVLELGAGIGDHTEWLLEQGAKTIYPIESRPENLQFLDDRFRKNKRKYDSICLLWSFRDIDTLDGIFLSNRIKFDIVYAYGILYHVADPEKAIRFMSESCNGITLIDTAVDYFDTYGPNISREDASHWTNNQTGACCRPGRRWLFDELKKHFEYVYMPITQPAHEQFPTDWTQKEQPFILVRSVYVASRKKIDNPVLLESVPMKQVNILKWI